MGRIESEDKSTTKPYSKSPQLRSALSEEWNRFPMQTINRLVGSIRARYRELKGDRVARDFRLYMDFGDSDVSVRIVKVHIQPELSG